MNDQDKNNETVPEEITPGDVTDPIMQPEPESKALPEAEAPEAVSQEGETAVAKEEAESPAETPEPEVVSQEGETAVAKEEAESPAEAPEPEAVSQEGETAVAKEEAESPAEAPEPEADEPYKHPIKARKHSYPFRQMVANFAGCGRCSYFLAGYRVLQGELVLEKAVSRMKANRLRLPWVSGVRELLIHSYGIHFDREYLHFNGCCPECKRPFSFRDDGKPNEPRTSFEVQFNLQKQRKS